VSSTEKQQILVIGGGAAGFFAAITTAENNPSFKVALFERTAQPLSKVKISGGGRCNVTNACYEPAELVTHYPRGHKELRGPFTRFQPRDIVAWFENRGVPLKTEPDNRIFPQSDQSESIILCLKNEATKAGVEIRTRMIVQDIEPRGTKLKVRFSEQDSESQDVMDCDQVILATGSSLQGWEWAKALGHTIVPPVPSLFSFTITDPRLEGLEGLSVPQAIVQLEGMRLKQKGAVLITHWGLSGPAILKISAWGARELHARNYQAKLHINWTGESEITLFTRFCDRRDGHPRNLVAADNSKELPRRLWSRLADAAGVPYGCRWAQVSNEHLKSFAQQITNGIYEVQGKGVFKDEFVTAGGVSLSEVSFKTMESKRCPGLYFAGEILDVDAETGGFNFQNAWTTGWIAAQSANRTL
jgi:predicted Rossmann fold flavoprotein